MKYIVEVNARRHTVVIDGADVSVDGTPVSASITALDGTPIRLVRVGEQVHRVVARRGGERGRYTLDVDGVALSALALDERLRTIRDLTAAANAASGPAPLLAPMPGLVVRIMAQPGDVVEAGQGLVVVEAMKMENELRATTRATVTAVHATVGAAVAKGAVLVELAPPPE